MELFESGVSSPQKQVPKVIATFILLLFLLAIYWMIRPRPTTTVEALPQASQVGSQDAGANLTDQPRSTPAKKKFRPVTRKGKWLLAPGETGVLSYVSEKAGLNGMLLVTLESDSKGKVTLQKKHIKITDEALHSNSLSTHMPDLFEFEKFCTLTPNAVQELDQTLSEIEGVSSAGSGSSWGAADTPRNSIATTRNSQGQMVKSESLNLLPHSAGPDGRYEVEVEYTTEFEPNSQ